MAKAPWGVVALVVAWLVSLALLLAALEWVARDHAPDGGASESGPVQIERCAATPCLVP